MERCFKCPSDIFERDYMVTIKGKKRRMRAAERCVLAYIYKINEEGKGNNVSYTKIAQRVGIDKGTACRIINTLVDNGYIEKTQGNSYTNPNSYVVRRG